MNPRVPSGPNLQFSAFGASIYVNWTLPFFGAGVAYLPAVHSGAPGVAAYFAAFVSLVSLLVFHELGHAVAARACSRQVRAIVLSGYGGFVVFDPPSRLLHAAVIVAGGVIAQLVMLVAAVLVLVVWGTSSSPIVNSVVFCLVGVNALYILWNLAPIGGSDGARLVAIARHALFSRQSHDA
jgi:Zn-dependent protease